jgi:hypothetical protein
VKNEENYMRDSAKNQKKPEETRAVQNIFRAYEKWAICKIAKG